MCFFVLLIDTGLTVTAVHVTQTLQRSFVSLVNTRGLVYETG